MSVRKTIFITGASRGVGLSIAKHFAKMGWNIAFVAKTVEPNPKLPGTLHTAAAEIKAAGANEVLAIPCNVRDLDALKAAIVQTGEKFGKIDVLINNASALYMLKTMDLDEKYYNLMSEVIVRSSLFAAKYAQPYLTRSDNPHIINIAPKPALLTKWFKGHTAYTIFKFASGMMVTGLADEMKEFNIGVNALWPATLLNTAAVKNLLGGDTSIQHSRHPEIMADAVGLIVSKPSSYTGNYLLDDVVVAEGGMDVASYSVTPGNTLIPDLYVETPIQA